MNQQKGKASYQLEGICESGTDRHIRIQQAIENMKNVLNIDVEYIDVAEFVKQRNLTDLEIREKSGMETKLYHKKLNMSFMTDGIIRYIKVNILYLNLKQKHQISFIKEKE